MNGHSFLSLSETAQLHGCTSEDVRRWVLEDRTLPALLVDLHGDSTRFELRGLRVYDVDGAGVVTSLKSGKVVGNLRFKMEDVVLHLSKLARTQATVVELDEVFPARPSETSNSEVKEVDRSLLATPAELVDAFGKWGLKAAWFKDLGSRKWLLEARRVKGRGQRGQAINPLYCPFAVMTGLIEKVRKENRVRHDTAWRTLDHKFPKVYAAFADYDPRERTGG